VKTARATVLLCLAAAGLVASACGKKGPPLAPLARVPGRAADLAVMRTGDAVAITFTIPAANIDETRPADIGRVDVYAYTAMAPSDVREPRRMTLVGSVIVRKPPEPETERADEAKKKPAPKPPPPPEPGEAQGARVTVTETLTAEMMVPVAPDRKVPERPQAEVVPLFGTSLVPALAGPVPKIEARRYYVVYGVSRGGNRGAASPRAGVPLDAPPAAPLQPRLETTEGGVVVNWDVPPGARLPYQEPAGEDVLEAVSLGMQEAPPITYVVYRVSPDGPFKLTEQPLAARTFTDSGIEFGAERCYDVRLVTTEGTVVVESAPSPPACITPSDTFPPPAPASLAAVAGEGVISLIWEGVGSADLAGYVVLRGDAPAGELTPLFEAPVRETTYRDTTAKPGARYVYAVVAVDRAAPPNRSAMSNKVEETAR
jgi:hypothetical protein